MSLARDKRRDRTRKHRYRQPRRSSLPPYGTTGFDKLTGQPVGAGRVQGLVGDARCRVGSCGHA